MALKRLGSSMIAATCWMQMVLGKNDALLGAGVTRQPGDKLFTTVPIKAAAAMCCARHASPIVTLGGSSCVGAGLFRIRPGQWD